MTDWIDTRKQTPHPNLYVLAVVQTDDLDDQRTQFDVLQHCPERECWLDPWDERRMEIPEQHVIYWRMIPHPPH